MSEDGEKAVCLPETETEMEKSLQSIVLYFPNGCPLWVLCQEQCLFLSFHPPHSLLLFRGVLTVTTRASLASKPSPRNGRISAQRSEAWASEAGSGVPLSHLEQNL